MQYAMREVLKQISKHYGLRPQLRQLQEECAELIVVVNKSLRALDNNKVIFSNVTEEIADVEIMTAQIKYLLNVGDEVETIKTEKIRRQIRRMSEDNNDVPHL